MMKNKKPAIWRDFLWEDQWLFIEKTPIKIVKYIATSCQYGFGQMGWEIPHARFESLKLIRSVLSLPNIQCQIYTSHIGHTKYY